jgi:tryptophan synthase alpha chain
MSGTPHQAAGLERRLAEQGFSVIPYLTGGFPNMAQFSEVLSALATVAPVVEIGIPFSDPMADGTTIQESSQVALEQGATLEAILQTVTEAGPLGAELVVMSYFNPLLAFGADALVGRLTAAGVGAVVVPDLPLEESGPLGSALSEAGIGLVQMVTPVTIPERIALLGSVSQGFTYAVTMTGTTGGRLDCRLGLGEYLDRVRAVSRAPVVAGFGVRGIGQVEALAPHCDGVIVGSALVEVVSSGADPVAFLEGLRS